MFSAESNSSCLGKDHFTTKLAAVPWESWSCAMKRCWVAKPLWKEEHGLTYNRIICTLFQLTMLHDSNCQLAACMPRLLNSRIFMFSAESNSSCLGKDHVTTNLAAVPWESWSCAMKRCWVAKPLWKEEHGLTYNRIICTLFQLTMLHDSNCQLAACMPRLLNSRIFFSRPWHGLCGFRIVWFPRVVSAVNG